MKLSAYKVDPEKLDSGIWWNFHTETTCDGNTPHASDPCFLVIPNISGRYVVALAEEQLPWIEQLRAAPPEDPAEREEHLSEIRTLTRRTRAEALARTTLKGWANLEDDDGKPLVWSPEAGRLMLSDRACLVYLDFVERAATNRDAAIAREEAKAAGNS